MRAHMLIAATLLLVAPALAKRVEIFTTSDLPALAHMNFTQMCQAFDQPCEQHEVTTEDGYILTIFRIKGDPKRPVLMWHGLPDSSDTFLVRGHNSTSATLAAAGYDVWVANSRGNKYSRRHKDWDPDKDKEKFWDFSIQEMGYYDIPATIDYILNETGEEKLSAIAHSMGTTIFFVLGSTRPEYNNKLKVFIPMAPVAFTTRMTSALSIGNRNWPVFRMGLVLTNTYEVMSSASIENTVLRFFCGDKIIGSLICKQIIVAAIGGEISDIEPELFEAAFARYLSGTSRKNLDHLAQIYNTGRFSKFSFGLADNRLKYGALYPPDYELKNMKTPVVMVCGQNDILADLEDIELLKKGLPNVAAQHILKDISHFDLVWGRNLNTYLHPLLKETLNKYS